MTGIDADGPNGRRVTLAHVAERAGVSRSAASFALNGKIDQRLSVDTFERVRPAANELGYRPNLTAPPCTARSPDDSPRRSSAGTV